MASYACISLTNYASRSTGLSRLFWGAVASISAGVGIWATHFIAILAFEKLDFGFDLTRTATSALVGTILSAMGIFVICSTKRTLDRAVGGALLGLGIPAMHYTGMSALILGGASDWNVHLIAASTVAAITIPALAQVVSAQQRAHSNAVGACLMTAGICFTHFLGMAAADFSNCYSVVGDISHFRGVFSAVIAGICTLLFTAALLGLYLDRKEQGRRATQRRSDTLAEEKWRESAKMLRVAAAHMSQAICVFDQQGVLKFHNRRLLTIAGTDYSSDTLLGRHYSSITPFDMSRFKNREDHQSDYEALLSEMREQRQVDYVIQLPSEALIRVVHSPIEDGWWVTTLDDITGQEHDRREIMRLARHDSMTGLLNRRAYVAQLDTICRESGEHSPPFAVLLIDLRKFSVLNDMHGQSIGDLVLQNIAARLIDLNSDGAVVARLAGDEFAIIKQVASVEDLHSYLHRLERAVCYQMELHDQIIEVKSSIGIALHPADGSDPETLLANAELAVKRSKGALEGYVSFYESEMHEQLRSRRQMANDIWLALRNEGFHLAYQIQKSAKSGRTTGYEVLLRWDRPGYGYTSPADFVPIAEECGAIVQIGEWVLRAACKEAARWQEKHKIAVNVSALQLTQLQFIDVVQRTLDTTGLTADRLELEVTETAIITDKDRALHILRALKDMGVSIALDDFGTGYSSLDTLRSFPFDKIKLDRLFVRELDTSSQSKAIVRAVLALGRSLAVPVLAEGVETQEQFDVLRKEGCSEVQGYLFGRPTSTPFALSDDMHDLSGQNAA